MRICILSAVLAVILIKDSCADKANDENNLITTYDPGETSTQTQISPCDSSYGNITNKDLPGQHGQTKFEDRFDDQPIKFEDDNAIDQTDSGAEFDNVGNSYQNHHFLKAGRSGPTFKFEDNSDTSDHPAQGGDDSKHSHARNVVFEDEKTAEDDFNYYDFDAEKRPANKPIKFENDGKDLYHTTDSGSYDRNTGRITFTDDNNRIPEKVQKKKRRPRRKPVQSQERPAQNSLYPGYPVYPDTNTPRPGSPGYPTPSYPGYPYPVSSYEPPIYPYPAYYGSAGYGLYTGYQGTGESRPPIYSNRNKGEQAGYSGYPSPGYSGSANLGATQSPTPGSYPRPDYPYNQGYLGTTYPQAYPGQPTAQYGLQGQVQYKPPGHPGVQQLGYQNGYYRPSRRPKSLPERALSAVAEALTSIALYDDYQCVPRLLCESAGGSTSLPPTLLKATEGLQPLLTLLQAYDGVSSSPLFVFGRAAVTGMAAKGNPAVCRQAYPQCPSDPEKLINYLNNHNGGFFRFFGQPAVPQQQQNLEQFYSYLSGQYGLLQQSQQNYGYPSPYRYGLLPQYPNPYNFGNNDLRYSYRNAKNETEIEERIQNKPAVNAFEDDNDQRLEDDQDVNSKWLFPEVETKEDRKRETFKIHYIPSIHNSGKGLKFPDESSGDRRYTNKPKDYVRKEKHVLFPKESYFQSYPNYYYQYTTPVNNDDYVFDHKHNFYVKRPKTVNTDDVVYVVRGNGDPNHPEIVKVRPGQSV